MSTENTKAAERGTKPGGDKQVADIRAALKRMPAPAGDQPRPARDVVIELADELLAKREQGYSWEDIHKVLSAGKVEIEIGTMKRYLQPSRGLKASERRDRGLGDAPAQAQAQADADGTPRPTLKDAPKARRTAPEERSGKTSGTPPKNAAKGASTRKPVEEAGQAQDQA